MDKNSDCQYKPVGFESTRSEVVSFELSDHLVPVWRVCILNSSYHYYAPSRCESQADIVLMIHPSYCYKAR